MKTKKVTMTDIANAANVSQATVSMILSGKKTSAFPAATVARVREAAAALNYIPKAKSAVRKPVSLKAKDILVLAVKMTNPYYPSMLQSMEREAAKHGLHIVTADTYYSAELEEQYLSMAVEKGFLAVIYLYQPMATETVKRMNQLLPIIAVCDRDSSEAADLVELNNYEAGVLAVEHLISLGHRNIAFLSTSMTGGLSRQKRMEGVRDRVNSGSEGCTLTFLTQKHYSAQESMEGDNYDYDSGYALAQDPVLYEKGITGIIAINAMVAFGAMDAVLEKGCRIPEDFSIIGFDNLIYTGLSRISLTTVDSHVDLLARAAIDVLLHRMNFATGNPQILETRFKVECMPRIIIRKSTAQVSG